MKKSVFILFLVLTMASFSFAVRNNMSASGGEDITVKEVVPFTYFCISHKGPFTEIENVIGQLMQHSRNQNVAPGGAMIGVYYNSPEEVEPEQLQWEIGFPVTPQILVQAPLEKKQWSFTTVATAVHTGSYEKAGETILKIFEWIEANNYTVAGPFLERYLNMDPSNTDPANLKTEIWIPCTKKQS